MIRIWADFTDLGGGLIPLDYKGSIRDIRRQNVVLREGLHIIVYDDSYQSEAIVEKKQGEWYARIIPGTGVMQAQGLHHHLTTSETSILEAL